MFKESMPILFEYFVSSCVCVSYCLFIVDFKSNNIYFFDLFPYLYERIMHNVYFEIVLIVNVVIQLNFLCKHDQK